jgi:hypothetical protein
MAKGCELSADVVRARADLHADQTAWEIGKTPLKLLPRTLQLENNCSALIEAQQMKGVLANIDADCSDRGRR